MQYGFWWLRKADGSLDRWVLKDPSLLLCPEHIKAIRATKLEDNAPSRLLNWSN